MNTLHDLLNGLVGFTVRRNKDGSLVVDGGTGQGRSFPRETVIEVTADYLVLELIDDPFCRENEGTRTILPVAHLTGIILPPGVRLKARPAPSNPSAT